MGRSVEPKPRKIELLAPAKNAETAISAITHGADAVYIGPEGFGARSAAANSTEDIRRLCDFAHPYRAKVYATVNTLVFDHELKRVERMIYELYRAGVDALIVQDMGILRMELPPIALHASTQCDIRTPQKARFLQEAGFSQIVLARELTLSQIEAICREVTIPVETFVHGALCVSYSGRCHASYALCGRSANRGRCAQVCRLPYRLRDASGRTLKSRSYLLSLKDFNASDLLGDMLRAGVSSFKIEGRLKDEAYVKNVTAYYRQKLDREIAASPKLYCRASAGECTFRFVPDPAKSFNRTFTHYFLTERRPLGLANMRTPKSMGEPIYDVSQLAAGDGISFFDASGEYTGVRVNRMENGHPIFARPVHLPADATLYRTTDYRYETLMSRNDTAERKISVDIELHEKRVCASDDRGCRVVIPVPQHGSDARKPMEPRRYFEKLGGTVYELRRFDNYLNESSFIPASAMTALRRSLIEALDSAARSIYARPLRHEEHKHFPYPEKVLTFADNVANAKAEVFYRNHGVTDLKPAIETIADYRSTPPGTVLMTTRHCILRELGLCKRETNSRGQKALHEPLSIENEAGAHFELYFNCAACEMQLLAPQK